jgi:hypothetical protein
MNTISTKYPFIKWANGNRLTDHLNIELKEFPLIVVLLNDYRLGIIPTKDYNNNIYKYSMTLYPNDIFISKL